MFPRDPLTALRAAALGSLALTALVAVACGKTPEPAPSGPAGAALKLFAIAGYGESDPERLDNLFDPEMNDRDRAALLDALIVVGATPAARVETVESLEGLGRSVVELTADLPGGGQANYAVHLELLAPESWRIVWFRGPGVQWPADARRRDEGLTTSAPPPPG